MFQQQYPAAWNFFRASCNTGGHPLARPAGWGEQREPGTWKQYHGVPVIELPPARLPDEPLAEVLLNRVSCRRFGGPPLELGELSNLLHGTYGVSGRVRLGEMELMERPVPSGGARYPLEVYLLVRRVKGLARGVHHYAPRGHCLEQLRGPLSWASVIRLFMDQEYLAEADLIVVFTAVVQRTLARYSERGFRLVLMECGHLAQNLNLLGTAMHLGSLDLGGFYDEHLAGLLGLDPDVEIPLYGVALGRPTAVHREEIRNAVPSEK
jgi:SagB-type dehydrogenase family enzyme